MGQFVRKLRRDVADDKLLTVDESLKTVAIEELFDGHGAVALDAREVVKVFPDVVAFALVEIDAVVGRSEHEVMEMPRFDLEFFLFLRAFGDGVVGQCETMALQGALDTVGVLGDALQGAELHHGLVVAAGMLAVKKLCGKVGKQLDAQFIINRCFDVVKP